MSKNFLFVILASVLLANFTACNKKTTNCIELPANCYKGRLEIQDICGDHTIKVLEGPINPYFFQTSWTHPKSNITYENVFTLGNICDFPASIKQGDEFYFQIRDNKTDLTCVRCLPITQSPDKTLSIIVSETPCNVAND